MTEPHNPDPMVYLMRQNGKHIAVCLSSVGKWIAGMLATLMTAGFIGTFSLILSSSENSRQALVEIKQVNSSILNYEKRTNKVLEKHDEQIRELEKNQGA